MLRVSGMTKVYGDIVALAGVELAAGDGQIVGLLGPNGAGKTTLISCIAGLIEPEEGTVEMATGSRLDETCGAPRIGMAPQETAVYPQLSVRKNLRYFGRLAGLRGALLEEEVCEVAELFGLADLLPRRANQLSGGEKRRLHTAIAVVSRPPILLLDEPTVGADVMTRSQILDAVGDLAANGSTVIYSTHYLHEVEQLKAEVAIIDRGQIIVQDSVTSLVARNKLSVVQLEFDVPPSRDFAIDLEGREDVSSFTWDESIARAHTSDPVAVISAISADPIAASHLQNIEILRPSLETVFLDLTGRRFESHSG